MAHDRTQIDTRVGPGRGIGMEGGRLLRLFPSRVWTDREILDMRLGDGTGFSAHIPVPTVFDSTIASVPVRIYASQQRASGVIVYLHGGCWVAGSLDSEDAVCRRLAESSGLAVISVGYRLAPEAPFPAASDDVTAVLREVRQFTGDGRIAGLADAPVLVCGSSAGASIAIGAFARSDSLAETVRAQAFLCPLFAPPKGSPSAHSFGWGYGLDQQMIDASARMYRGHQVSQSGESAECFPAPDDLGTLPPTMIVTAALDPCRDDGEAFLDSLAAAGVPTSGARFLGLPHEFFLFVDRGSTGQLAVDQVGAYLRSAAVARPE